MALPSVMTSAAGNGSTADDEGPPSFPPASVLASHFLLHLRILPSPYSTLDCNRLTMAHFAVGGLDLMHRTASGSSCHPPPSTFTPAPHPPPCDASPSTCRLTEPERRAIIHWVYGLQSSGDEDGGFRGSPCMAVAPLFPRPSGSSSLLPPPTPPTCWYDRAHLASTYSALVTLLCCGDDLSHVDRPSVLAHLSRLQLSSGCFRCSDVAEDADLRFVYCALATCALLGDASYAAIPRLDAAIAFVLACQTYEGGFAMQPHAEAHGAGTYLAVACLALTGRLEGMEARARQRLVGWAVRRQGGVGYTGRTEKAPDSCYSFWVGAALRILGVDGCTRPRVNGHHLALCADGKRGGFGKEEGQRADLLHSYMATAGLGLMQTMMREQAAADGVEENGGVEHSLLWPYPVQPMSATLGLAVDRIPPAVADLGFR